MYKRAGHFKQMNKEINELLDHVQTRVSSFDFETHIKHCISNNKLVGQ